MEEKDWNPEDWQGRSKKQVEGTYFILSLALIGLAVFYIGYAIMTIFNL